jgi:TRAP transporter TAXI family solute receptor
MRLTITTSDGTIGGACRRQPVRSLAAFAVALWLRSELGFGGKVAIIQSGNSLFKVAILNLRQLFSRSMAQDPVMYGPPVRRRSRLLSMTTLSVIAAMIALGTAIAAGVYYYNRPVTLRIAVGPTNSDDFRVVQAIARVFDPQGGGRERSSIKLRVVPTEGSVQSAVSMDAGSADLAVIRGDQTLPKDAQAVALMRKNLVAIWAPAAPAKSAKGAAAPRIKSIEDLAGQRIGVIGRGQSNVNLLRTILQQYGVADDKVTIIQLPPSAVLEAVKNARVDAYMAVGPANSQITADAVAAASRDGETPNFLPIELADSIASRFAAYDAAEIAPGAFGSAPARPQDTIKTISFDHYIVAKKSISDSTITAFTRQLFTMRQALIAEFAGAARIEVPDTDKDAAVPVHAGAEAYIDGEERTFMDRYSDLIWWSILGTSLLGSLSAWFASYLKRDERTANVSLRARLLEMLSEARRAESHESLDAMQAEADEILRNTLDCYEDGTIESGALTAFQIALEQFHNAVADRRLVLPDPAIAQVRPSRPAVA